MGKETKSEERKEMKVSPAMYRKGEKAEGIHGKFGMDKPSKYAKGGFTRAADGIAQKGKTKGRRFDDGGMVPTTIAPAPAPAAVDPNTTVGPPPDRLYQSLPAGQGSSAGTAPVNPSGMGADSKDAFRENKRAFRGAERDAKMAAFHTSSRRAAQDAENAARTASNAPGVRQALLLKRIAEGKVANAARKVERNTQDAAHKAAEAERKGPRRATSPSAAGMGMKKGGCVTKMARGGGCEIKGKTKGRFV